MIQDDYNIVAKILSAALTIMTGGILWLVRTVFTNAKKIEVLEARLKNQEHIMNEVKDKQDELYKLLYEYFRSAKD